MDAPRAIGGSFRDPAARVYTDGKRILRGVDATTLYHFKALAETSFYREALGQQRVVGCDAVDPKDAAAVAILTKGWAGVVEHELLPLISYPYEWTFSMLRDAANLQMDLLVSAMSEGWVLKDSTPYNIQFLGSWPIFIDLPSFTPRPAGDYWRGYRQFCMMFLYPLMLASYRGIAFQGWLRSSLDGITPVEAARHFSGMSLFRKGVLTHVRFPAALERRVTTGRPNGGSTDHRVVKRQSDAMVLGLAQSMRRIVQALPAPSGDSTWVDYTTTHSYDPASYGEKERFVAEAAAQEHHGIAWDLGCNTGTFSEILARFSDHVVALDGDLECVERLYLRLRARGDRKILPLYMDLLNPSPNQGFANAERMSFNSRNKPDLVIVLALIHHVCLSGNVPIPAFLDWLKGTGAKLIIEFVDRGDAMAAEILARKTEPHADYNLRNFERELNLRYDVIRWTPMKGGERRIYYCAPRG